KSSSHFKSGEAGRACGGFAGREDSAADAAAGKIGGNKESADFGGFGFGVEQVGFGDDGVGGGGKRFGVAPGAAAGQGGGAGGRGFGDEVGAVGDQLCVEAEYGAEGSFDLFGRVVAALENADGELDELVKSRDVGGRGETER